MDPPLSRAVVSASSHLSPVVERLIGRRIPSIPLQSTEGRHVDLSTVEGRIVVFVHPGIQVNGASLPAAWTSHVGLAGCTAEACLFRDLRSAFAEEGASVYGLSTLPIEIQLEFRWRLSLNYHLVSDSDLRFVQALGLPVVDLEGTRLAERITLILSDGIVEEVFHPVPDAEENAVVVYGWLLYARRGSFEADGNPVDPHHLGLT